MPAPKVETIRLKLDHLVADRTQFKPYIAQLSGENIFVDVNIPSTEVKVEGKQIILTVDGMAAVLGKVATAIETMNSEWQTKKFGH